MRSSEINKKFVEYYKTENFQLLPRAPMLDDSIPMSFVMSAGLVQVEKSLEKIQTRETDKFVLVQDCFRHFDLEQVGMDDIHLSFFKMPGAFKFGPNEKIGTIERMWHLATSIFGIEQSKLWASYFAGDTINGSNFQEDNIVRQTWNKVGLPNNRIIGLGKSDNFWLQGNGFNSEELKRKSGPNTELFYDRGEDRACRSDCRPGCTCGRFVEFSNSLFIRYELDPKNGVFRSLDDPFSETVIGAERIAMILQEQDSVFEIDLYKPVINLIRNSTVDNQLDYYEKRVAERMLADHLRALVHLIADDAPPPGKNGRQRLVKKLIRGLITGIKLLGISKQEFLNQALDFLINDIDNISVLKRNINNKFHKYYSMQEETFNATIDRGMDQFETLLKNRKNSHMLPEQIVRLEKEWGVPYLLIANELRCKGIPVSEGEYKQAIINWKKNNIFQN